MKIDEQRQTGSVVLASFKLMGQTILLHALDILVTPIAFFNADAGMYLANKHLEMAHRHREMAKLFGQGGGDDGPSPE